MAKPLAHAPADARGGVGHHRGRRWTGAAIIAALVAAAVPLRGADAQQAGGSTLRDSLGRRASSASAARAPLVTHRELTGLGTAIVLTGAIAPFDARIRAFMQSPRLQRMRGLRPAANGAAFMGGPGPFLLGAALFAGGRAGRARSVADVGVHLTEAVLLSAAIDGLGKGISGRALPQHSTDPDNIEIGRGFHRGNGPYVSFPSGHTAAAFAMATVLTREAERWHPEAGRIIAPLAYGGASLIGVARVYQNLHWASDLPLAAAIGTWSGISIVSRQHMHPHNVVERLLLRTGFAPASHGGAMLTWSLPDVPDAR